MHNSNKCECNLHRFICECLSWACISIPPSVRISGLSSRRWSEAGITVPPLGYESALHCHSVPHYQASALQPDYNQPALSQRRTRSVAARGVPDQKGGKHTLFCIKARVCFNAAASGGVCFDQGNSRQWQIKCSDCVSLSPRWIGDVDHSSQGRSSSSP